MPEPELQRLNGALYDEVLTLAEAAAFLRVPEEAVAKLSAEQAIPVQRIGQEWRFLKRALVDWLRFGPNYNPVVKGLPPPWVMDSALLDDLVLALEQRIMRRMTLREEGAPKPGSKQAVLKLFGVWKDDPWVKSRVAEMYGRESPGRTEGEE